MEAMENILTSFGETIDIPELAFDEDNFCCLMFDEISINLEVDVETEELFFSSPLCPIPEEANQKFCEMLLEANFFYRETGGASLGMNREADMIQFLYSTPYQSLDLIRFEKIMESMVNLSELWIERIQSWKPGTKKEKFKDNSMDLRFRV